MRRDKWIKVRASDYDKALVKALAASVTEHNKLYSPTEADMVRMALSEMAKRYLTTDQLRELDKEYRFKE